MAESRGGTPRGERAAIRARRTPLGAVVGYASLGVLLPFFFFRPSWLKARIVRLPAPTAGILWRRSVRRAEKFSSRDDDSGADRIARTRSLFHLSPRAGRGWGEGASPPESELRQSSESRQRPLTLPRFARSTFPARGRGEKAISFSRCGLHPSHRHATRISPLSAPTFARRHRRWTPVSSRSALRTTNVRTEEKQGSGTPRDA